jgi:hypothetical protein
MVFGSGSREEADVTRSMQAFTSDRTSAPSKILDLDSYRVEAAFHHSYDVAAENAWVPRHLAERIKFVLSRIQNMDVRRPLETEHCLAFAEATRLVEKQHPQSPSATGIL